MAFRKMAVERLKRCDHVVALSQELGVNRLLYKWRDQLEPIEDGEGPAASSRERALRQQVTRLKRVVADKTDETRGGEFFQRCLARNRGSTPEQKQVWRDGIYEQIREVMPMQGGLSIERMLFHQLNWPAEGKEEASSWQGGSNRSVKLHFFQGGEKTPC